MRSTMVKALTLSLVALAAAAALVVAGRGGPAVAANGDPQFKVVCVPQREAPDDPIVFPGQPGKSHDHTFFGARYVDAGTTLASLLANDWSACGRNFGLDKTAYWIPTLVANGTSQFDESEDIQLAVYYKRAGAAGGAPVAQAFPQGLRMVAGDPMATTVQPHVLFKCAKLDDAGNQSQLVPQFPSCAGDENIIEELVFPDCWDGVHLDSANHKSHMAYSSAAAGTCPADHPVKLPQITFEAWYHTVVGVAPASLALSSGGPYSFHGDVFSAWSDPRAAAALVNECVNANRDCTPNDFHDIVTDAALARVTQAQIDAQLRPGQSQPPAAAAPPAAGSGDAGSTQPPSGHAHGAPAPATAAAAAPSSAAPSQAPVAPTTTDAQPTPPGDPTTSPAGSAVPGPTSSGGASGALAGHAGHGEVLASTGEAGGSQPRPGWIAAAGLTTGGAALGAGSFLLWRRRPKLWRWHRPVA